MMSFIHPTRACYRHLLIALVTMTLFLRTANPLLSRWIKSNDDDASANAKIIISECLSYVTRMNINNRYTVAVVVNSNATEPYSNEFIRSIINSTNLLIINTAVRDRIAKASSSTATSDATMTKNPFGKASFRHRLGPITIYFLEISSLSSLHDKLWFIAKAMPPSASGFDSRGSFIVWYRSVDDDDATLITATAEGHKAPWLQNFLRKAFELLWQFNIFNVIIVTCSTKNNNNDDANDKENGRDPPNCPIFTWFPYSKSGKCGTNTANFILVDRCEFRSNDEKFYVNYLNSSRRVFPNDFSDSVDQKIPQMSLKSEPSGVGYNHRKSCRNLHYIRNYFKWKARGILEYRDRDATGGDDVKEIRENVDFETIKPELRHFFNKIPKQFDGCSFRALIFVWPPFVTPPISAPWIGIEHKLFLDISRMMNFRLAEIYVQRKLRESMNVLGNIFENFEADLAFGNLYPNIEQHQIMDYSIGYYYDHLNWVVPLAGDQPVWLNLIHCFGVELWILVAMVAAIFSTLYARISQRVANESFVKSIFDCFMVAVAASKQKLPSNGILRFLLMIWIIYCFHINLMYQVQLMSVLTTPTATRQISTSAEIISSGLEFGFAENFVIHLRRINDSESRYFIEKNRQCTFETCLAEMSKKPFATLGNRMYVQYTIAFHGGKTKIFTIRKTVAKSFLQMYMKKGFPLRDRLNWLIRRMVEIGYVEGSQRAFKNLIGNISIDGGQRFRHDLFLNLEHYVGAFLGLTLGSCIGAIVFIIECYTGRRRSKKKVRINVRRLK